MARVWLPSEAGSSYGIALESGPTFLQGGNPAHPLADQMDSEQIERMLTIVNSEKRKAADRYVHAALRLVSEHGPSSVTIRSVGDVLGVTGPAIYRHFRDKSELLRGVFSAVAQEWRKRLDQAAAEAEPAVRFRQVLEAYCQFAIEDPELYSTLIRPSAAFLDAGVEEEAHQARAATHRILTAVISDCMRVGVVREDDPAEVAIAVWGFLHGLLSLYRPSEALDRKEIDRFQELFGRSIERLINGLG